MRKKWYYVRTMEPNQFQREFLDNLMPGLQLAPLFDYLPEVYLYVKNRKSQFVWLNVPMRSIMGVRDLREAIGKTDLDFYPRDLAEQYIAEDRLVMEKKAPLPNQAWLVPGVQGKLKWYISSKLPLLDKKGRVVGIAGAMRDYDKADLLLEPYREMQDVVSYIVNHYAEPIAIPELAAMLHLSVSQFDRRFKKVFQVRPSEFIMKVRINAASRLLITTDLPINTVSLETGFYDQSYFTKQFRRLMKMTPLKYRKKYSGE